MLVVAVGWKKKELHVVLLWIMMWGMNEWMDENAWIQIQYRWCNTEPKKKNDWIRSGFIIFSTRFYVIIKYQIQYSERIPVGHKYILILYFITLTIGILIICHQKHEVTKLCSKENVLYINHVHPQTTSSSNF